MEDKDVGKLLRKRITELEKLYPDRSGVQSFEMDIIVSLIRKLVIERRRYYDLVCELNSCSKDEPHSSMALRDFGISEKDWGNHDT